MRLIVVHYHLRPGGIRRIIEQALPAVCSTLRPKVGRITLLTGEATEPAWLERLRQSSGGILIDVIVEPAAGYLAGQHLSPAVIRRRIRNALKPLVASPAFLWAHNLGIARNILLSDEITRAARNPKIRLISHHHDLWFDNRWIRRPEMKRAGFTSMSEIADAIFPTGRNIHHLAINGADHRVLDDHLGKQAAWMPNLALRPRTPSKVETASARGWLRKEFNHSDDPVWLLPCRLLRRKNVAEALLLARWLSPDAWLATTGTASSDDETRYHDRLDAAARKHGWKLKLGILGGDPLSKPSVAHLMSAAEAVLFTSIQEGFGLPYLEATHSRRPLICRRLPNISPDLETLGFRFPHSYDEILVPASLFQHRRELVRQRRVFEAWRAQMPANIRRTVGPPWLLANPEADAVPFSRLTLTAQLELLAQPPDESWQACAPQNPFLANWRDRAAGGTLRKTAWPAKADRYLGPAAYARRFAKAVSEQSRQKPMALPVDVQSAFMKAKLHGEFLYPLLMQLDS
ncbi:MAG TPA: glycosyltransferase [Roseimicrobium sp.]|nr:glycosyltransferase [Roseimicrobium sp.]